MAATKLTLRLDDELIRQAKAYAKRSGKSVSRLVADYFSMLGSDLDNEQLNVTPKVRTLWGALRDGTDDENTYRAHLEKKHLETAD